MRFALLPGGLTDAATAADLLWEKIDEVEALRGKERFGAVLEAKHFDMSNLARAVDEGKHVLFNRLGCAATPWIREAVEEAVKEG
ncbi:hypothetical protein SUTMEG_10170 [Sutterella megalosphaeroides]|uniref:Uncharacterized protein n=1 Tax=Sutterella megalosphaeroides TaxID=2494234 RepID=A0A2Z6IEJ5_9BURK|nr:hypothetical protein SUTMEG_10170 [Sutterella megalosphaeroides]